MCSQVGLVEDGVGTSSAVKDWQAPHDVSGSVHDLLNLTQHMPDEVRDRWDGGGQGRRILGRGLGWMNDVNRFAVGIHESRK